MSKSGNSPLAKMIDFMKQKIILLIFLVCALAQSFAEEIKLADASASASVENTVSPSGFRITVTFYPVTTLDEVSNSEMTETMAQFYAEEALSKRLRSQKAISFKKVKSSRKNVDGGKARWIFAVPTEAVIDAPVKSVELREEIVGGASKKTGKASVDAKTKMLEFRSSCFRDLRIAEALFAEEIDLANVGKEGVALQQKIEAAFNALRKKIKADDDLFRAEKAELIEKADKVESYLLARITSGGGKKVRKEDNAKLPISGALFKDPFGDLLKSDPILLTHGGARLIEMDDGAIAILAVGSARAENEDREDIAELTASAALGKLQAGEESLVENKVERTYSRSVVGNKESEDVNVKRTSTVSINSIDFHKCGETVGTWFSLDGKRFFMAKGRIVRPQLSGKGTR